MQGTAYGVDVLGSRLHRTIIADRLPPRWGAAPMRGGLLPFYGAWGPFSGNGGSVGELLEHEVELLADPKERSEHLMLVDLARNDLGRVCLPGSVKVPDYAIVERYSHVMHIVSQVEGQLAPDKDAFDLFRATFPAGTLSGAPKVRAMQVISELEGERRGVYGGAVGYFGFDGGHDSCIVIRTASLRDGVASIQAGAGVVADSVPTSEYEETINKSKSVLRALGLAAGLRS